MTPAPRQSSMQKKKLRDVRGHHLSFQQHADLRRSTGMYREHIERTSTHMYITHMYIIHMHVCINTPPPLRLHGPTSLPGVEATSLQPGSLVSWAQSSERPSGLFSSPGRAAALMPTEVWLEGGGYSRWVSLLSTVLTVGREKNQRTSEVRSH